MNRQWAAALGLTVIGVGALGSAWYFKGNDAPMSSPAVVPAPVETGRTSGGGEVARSGPATPAPTPPPGAAAPSAPVSSPVSGSPSGAASPSAPMSSASTASAAAPDAKPDAPRPASSAPTGLIRPAPRFDVVRVERDGSAVVAGRAEPGAQVTLMVDGKPVAQAAADAGGQFVILPPPFASGERTLSLASRGKDGGEAVSPQSVTILGADKAAPVVALAEPGSPTKILSDAAPSPSSGLRIRTVEAEQGGAFYASGMAPAGSTVRLYLNDGHIAQTRATAEGTWSVRVEKGMTAGDYEVRADQLDAGGKVAARAQVTFAYPQQSATPAKAAEAPKPPAPAPAPAASPVVSPAASPAAPPAAEAVASSAATPAEGDAQRKPADASVPQVRTTKVVRGDSLWRMSAKLYGRGVRYTEIYQANADQIRNPDLIYPGQILVAPESP